MAKRKRICQTNETLFQLVAHIRGLKKSRPRKLVRKMEGTAGNRARESQGIWKMRRGVQVR